MSTDAVTTRRQAGAVAAPTTGTAGLLAETLAAVMEIDGVGPDSHFFDDLGADSMVMAHFCARLRKRDDLPSIPIKQVYQHPTIGDLAAVIDGARPQNGGAGTNGAGADGAVVGTTDGSPVELPPSPPPTVTPAVPVGRAGYWLCGLLQLLALGGLILIGALGATVGYDWVSASSDLTGLYLRSAGFAAALFVGTSAVPVLLKWILVGRWKPGRFRVWSLAYFRFWLVRLALRTSPMAVFVGSPIYGLYLRALGARIGRGTLILSRPVPVCADLLTIGDNAVILKDSQINCYRANAGYIEMGPVAIGANAVIGELTVLDIDSSVGAGAQLGHVSTLDAGQSIPPGERWVGTSAHQRVDVDHGGVDPVAGSARRRVLYPIAQLAILFGLTLPIGSGLAMALAEWQITPAALVGDLSVQLDQAIFYEEVLLFSLVLFLGVTGTRLLLATVLPRLLRRAIRPGTVYPLFGVRYGIHRLIQRYTNARFFTRLLGDSSYIVHYLYLLGYDVSFEEQTGANFGQTIKHDNPYAVSVGPGTMVADVISLINAEYSNTSFRISPVSIGAHSFFGNQIGYPAGARTGENCLHASKVAVPLDGQVREGVGLLGSPSFEIPRSVYRDAEFHEPTDAKGRPRRLKAKNRHNIVTMAWFLLTRWLATAGAVGLALLAADLYPYYGAWSVAGTALIGLVVGTLYLVLVERASTGFKRLRPVSCSIYDRRSWRIERFWKLSSQPRVFNGTPFKPVVWRLLGVKMGRRVFDDGCAISEKTMATVGDHCTLNAGSVIQPHSQEDGALKSDYSTVGAGCTLGIGSLVHYGVTMNDNSTLAPGAFLMKGSDVPPGTYWAENPAREIATIDGSEPPTNTTAASADDEKRRTATVTKIEDHAETARTYWRQVLLAGGPTTVPRWTASPTTGIETTRLVLDDRLGAALRRQAEGFGVALDAVVLAAHARVLSTLSGETEVLTGLVTTAEAPAVPCRLSVEPATWRDLVDRADATARELRAHLDYPVDALREELHLSDPPFETVLDVSGRRGDETRPDPDGETLWRLSVVDGDSITLACTYRTDAIDADAAARVLGYHERALTRIAIDPTEEHGDQTLLDDDELDFQLDGLAGPNRELPYRRMHELFEATVRADPDAVAAIHRDEAWSYKELNSRANRIGRTLLARGVERETVVAVVTERNLDWMAIVLAIFKAGGVYLPIEPHFPAERMRRTLDRADCKLVVTEYGSGDNLFDALRSLDAVDTVFVEGAYRESDDRDLGVQVDEDQLAYIYFTSGSTGEPKGAMCEHAGMLNHLFAKIDDLEIGQGEVVAQVAPQCFDISLWQLVSALLVGGRTLIVEQDILLDPERFLDRVIDGRVAVLQVVPSYLEVLLSYLDQHPRELPDLHCVSVTGEALSLELTQRWFAAQPGIKLANAYGLTETSDDTNHEVMDRPPEGDRVPLGPAVNNVSVRVVDPGNLQPVPLGAPGEIVFSGVCVGRGYINDPERTAHAFLTDPLRLGQRLYRSGDFGRWRPDGKLEFLGRRDAQVKIRGFRIEIGSIENHMLSVAGVHQAAVVVVERPDGTKQLVGFFTGDSIDVDTVRAQLERALPEYMVPTRLHRQDDLPLTDNGKVDRKTLRASALELDGATAVEPPATAAERRLAATWSRVLAIPEDQIGRNDDFFDRGSSLTAVELVIALDGAVTLKDVAQKPVLADMAALIGQQATGPNGLLHQLSDSATGPAGVLVCFPYAGGNAINYRAMAAELRDSGLAVHAVELPGHDPAAPSEAFAPMDDVVTGVVEELAALEPPSVLLWGHSAGAAFALETARRLEGEGIRVDRLFLAAQLPTQVASRRAHLAQLAERSDGDIAADLMTDGGYTELRELDDNRARHVGAAYRHDCRSAHAVILDALEGPPMTKLAAPVTVVVADDDPSTAGASDRFEEWKLVADRVELHRLPDGGHYFLRTRPAEAAAVVTAVVANVEPGSAVEVAPGHPPIVDLDGTGDGTRWLADRRSDLRELVAEHGAVVIRGLDLDDVVAVGEAVSSLADRTMPDLEAFASRDAHPGGIYSSSAWPPKQQMCMHHELSYRIEFPGLMVFACLVPPTEGGSIGLADASKVLEALPAELVDRFDREGWMLVRNYTDDIGLSAAEAFGTDDRGAIERYCRDNAIDVEWLAEGGLRTRQRRRAIVDHPKTGRRCWFNQIAFLSRWTMDPEVRDFLVDLYGEDGLPFDTRFGNGDPIDEDVVRLINEVYEANTSRVEPAAGDIVLVDNLRTAHSRDAYEGDREVLVAMVDPISLDGAVAIDGTSAPISPPPAPPPAAPIPSTDRRPPTTNVDPEKVNGVMHPTATIVPVTAQLRRFIDRAPSEVFAAYRDVDRRVRWQPDPEEIIVLESHDFQVGGVDRFLYRSRHYPSLAGMVRYERIIDDECMVYTRRLSDTGDRTLAVSVVSWSLRPKGSGTEITLAEQTTSLDGSAPIEGSKYRLATMLDRLAAHLTVGG